MQIEARIVPWYARIGVESGSVRRYCAGGKFVRVKAVRSGSRSYRYLHIVENRWENGRTRQRIVGSLGRLDELQSRGDLEQVIRQLVEHCPAVKLLRAQADGCLAVLSDRVWGPVLVFDRLWEELGLKARLRAMAQRRQFEFDLERMIFAQVLQRLASCIKPSPKSYSQMR